MNEVGKMLLKYSVAFIGEAEPWKKDTIKSTFLLTNLPVWDLSVDLSALKIHREN